MATGCCHLFNCLPIAWMWSSEEEDVSLFSLLILISDRTVETVFDIEKDVDPPRSPHV